MTSSNKDHAEMNTFRGFFEDLDNVTKMFDGTAKKCVIIIKLIILLMLFWCFHCYL